MPRPPPPPMCTVSLVPTWGVPSDLHVGIPLVVGAALESVSTSHTNCLGASISTVVLMVMLRSVSSAPCRVVGGGLPVGVVAEDIDAAVCFGHVDHAATVDKDVLGLVDELGRYWAAAFLGVIGDEVAGD